MLNDATSPIVEIDSAMHKDENQFSIVSMFSGCGGIDLGFLGGFSFLGKRYAKNPCKIIWANDMNRAACRTYEKNINHKAHVGDVWEAMKTLPDPDDVDFLVGGFPCQDISVNGKGLGINGARSGLYRAMVEAIRILKPKAFVAENVKGLLMKHNEDSLNLVLNNFKALGYNVVIHLYNAADYGVPQTRERVFIVGTLPQYGEYSPPNPTHDNSWVTAKEALHDLEVFEENPEFNHIWSKAKKSPDQGNRKLKSDRAGHTIRAECHGNIQYHYLLDRRISMREAARLQSFPDNFVFETKLRETERQIGNAVPPVLAWHICQRLIETVGV